MKRNRVIYLIAACAVIALGLASRRYAEQLPDVVAKYAGDTLWALTAFLMIGLVAPRWTTRRATTAALLVSYGVEISQLYHASWIDVVRETTLGGLMLGYGFLWSDVVCYTAGVALGAGIEIAMSRTSARRNVTHATSDGAG